MLTIWTDGLGAWIAPSQMLLASDSSSHPLPSTLYFLGLSTCSLVSSGSESLVQHEQQHWRLLLLIILHDCFARASISTHRRCRLPTHAPESRHHSRGSSCHWPPFPAYNSCMLRRRCKGSARQCISLSRLSTIADWSSTVSTRRQYLASPSNTTLRALVHIGHQLLASPVPMNSAAYDSARFR